MKAPRSARALAQDALAEWRHGRRFADSIVQELLAASGLSSPDRAFVTELFYGALRNLSLLDFWIAQLRSASLDDASRDLLRLGLYQLLLLQMPEHAAVFETVELAPKKSRGLINGVLRNAVRNRAELQAAADTASLAVRTSQPQFLIDGWTAAFGTDAAEQLCRWNNHPPQTYARINLLKTNAQEFLAAEETRAIIPDKHNFVRVERLPNEALERGECYIQDPSTSVACELLAPQPGDTVLDACAAPGGKTGYLAELMNDSGTLFACDRDADRLSVLTRNLQQLGVTNARVLQQDWTCGEISGELRGLQFDRMLIDAPCSNTGVMRRRVDVRWRLRPNEFAKLAAEQLRIVAAVAPLLKPGGVLVYSTCSIEKEENGAVAERIQAADPSLHLEDERAVLPFRDGFDGAYAAGFVRDA